MSLSTEKIKNTELIDAHEAEEDKNMENKELNLEDLELVSGGELTQENKNDIDRYMRYMKARGIRLDTILRVITKPEQAQYIKEHWDSY